MKKGERIAFNRHFVVASLFAGVAFVRHQRISVAIASDSELNGLPSMD